MLTPEKEYVSKTPEATAMLAECLARALAPGDCILLSGPIGAGKSHFARSLIQRRLADAGKVEDVPSPTFTLVQTYDDGISEIWHADLYRVMSEGELDELGLSEAFDGAVCLIEWPELIAPQAPQSALRITFEPLDDPGSRRLTFSYSDPRWNALLASCLP